MISIDNILRTNYPALADRPMISKVVVGLLRRWFRESEFQAFAARYPHMRGLDFAEQVLQYFNVNTQVTSEELERIPSHGRVVIIANHPIGSLDGLALIRMIGSVRRDLKVVATEVLNNIEPLTPVLIPVDNFANKISKQYLRAIDQHLDEEGALLIFPAGEVSRVTPQGIRDGKWQAGFYRMARRAQAPVLPIFVNARNSLTFYLASMIYRPLSTLLLVPEMFKRRGSDIKLSIGRIIPFNAYNELNLDRDALIKLFAKHVYRIGKGKPELFKTESGIAHPEDRQSLRTAIEQCECLGATRDGKKIVIFQGEVSSPLLREIGRLREVTFRAVGEGSGKRRDLDKYDPYYHHLILWDDKDLEIAGAYRLGCVADIFEQHGSGSLYTQSLFGYTQAMDTYFDKGLELGRSFVQPKYWGKRSLDYLWQGIGAFLRQHPEFRYLFGPITVPNTLPDMAKRQLIYVYMKHFFAPEHLLATSNNPYHFGDTRDLEHLFDAKTYDADLKTLKHQLNNMGASIPTLFKQYVELCDEGGVQFIDFGKDPDFANAVDGLVLLDLAYLNDSKRKRYLDTESPSVE